MSRKKESDERICADAQELPDALEWLAKKAKPAKKIWRQGKYENGRIELADNIRKELFHYLNEVYKQFAYLASDQQPVTPMLFTAEENSIY